MPPMRVGWAGSLNNQTSAHRGVPGFIVPAVAAVDGAELCLAAREERLRDVDEMRDFYQSLHVYVCASRSEGTPNPCLEAAACGLPVVTTPVGNMPEFVRDGVNGFFVARDVDAIAATLRRLRDDPELRERMGHAARDGRGVELRADASGDDVDPVFLERTGQPRQREEHERQGDEPHHAAGEDVGRQLVHADHVLVDDQRQDLRVGEDQEVLQRRQRERAGQGAPVPERVTEQKPHSGARRFRILCLPATMDTWTAVASSCRRMSGSYQAPSCTSTSVATRYSPGARPAAT